MSTPPRERSAAVTATDAAMADGARSADGPQPRPRPDADDGARTGACAATHPGTGTATGDEGEDTLDLPLPNQPGALHTGMAHAWAGARARPADDRGGDLLDRPADWAPAATPAGPFRLVPVRIDRDLALVSHWMNDPAVAAFWELAGPPSVTEDHLRTQLDGDGRSVPCLGMLGDTPMSYWEVYRADLDPLARHYPARPHDTGLHLLIGGVADRGRGLGTVLLRAVTDLVLDHRPSCSRVVAEPDLRNTPSVSAFLSAGFRLAAELDLPGKRAALMVCDRALRPVLRPEHSE